MISIDKLVQQLSQCKDTSITLSNFNDSIFVQKNAIDIKKYELELLNNNFEQLNEANYTMDSEIEKQLLESSIQNHNIKSESSRNDSSRNDSSRNDSSRNDSKYENRNTNHESIPSKSLIIYTENETANIPEIIIKLLVPVFKLNDLYIYGVKNPESFYKSFLLLTKVDFIIKNKTEKKNDVATIKREMAMQYENFYKTLNYRKMRFPRNDMVNNLTNKDNYVEFDVLQFISDYNKVNFIMIQ